MVIADAQERASQLEQRVNVLNNEIAELSAQITQKNNEITDTQTALEEVVSVKALLEQSSEADTPREELSKLA
jgi:prefoldin subunit 5